MRDARRKRRVGGFVELEQAVSSAGAATAEEMPHGEMSSIDQPGTMPAGMSAVASPRSAGEPVAGASMTGAASGSPDMPAGGMGGAPVAPSMPGAGMQGAQVHPALAPASLDLGTWRLTLSPVAR